MSVRSRRRREWNGSMRKRKMYLSVEDVAELCKERDRLYEKQNDLGGKRQALEWALEK